MKHPFRPRPVQYLSRSGTCRSVNVAVTEVATFQQLSDPPHVRRRAPDPLVSRDSVKTTPRGLPYSASAVASILQS
jgi:hypothetical protein